MSTDRKFTATGSSSISEFSHDPVGGALTVQFRGGGRYIYAGVSADQVKAMAGADSVGGYFAKHIKPKHAATKL